MARRLCALAAASAAVLGGARPAAALSLFTHRSDLSFGPVSAPAAGVGVPTGTEVNLTAAVVISGLEWYTPSIQTLIANGFTDAVREACPNGATVTVTEAPYAYAGYAEVALQGAAARGRGRAARGRGRD